MNERYCVRAACTKHGEQSPAHLLGGPTQGQKQPPAHLFFSSPMIQTSPQVCFLFLLWRSLPRISSLKFSRGGPCLRLHLLHLGVLQKLPRDRHHPRDALPEQLLALSILRVDVRLKSARRADGGHPFLLADGIWLRAFGNEMNQPHSPLTIHGLSCDQTWNTRSRRPVALEFRVPSSEALGMGQGPGTGAGSSECSTRAGAPWFAAGRPGTFNTPKARLPPTNQTRGRFLQSIRRLLLTPRVQCVVKCLPDYLASQAKECHFPFHASGTGEAASKRLHAGEDVRQRSHCITNHASMTQTSGRGACFKLWFHSNRPTRGVEVRIPTHCVACGCFWHWERSSQYLSQIGSLHFAVPS